MNRWRFKRNEGDSEPIASLGLFNFLQLFSKSVTNARFLVFITTKINSVKKILKKKNKFVSKSSTTRKRYSYSSTLAVVSLKSVIILIALFAQSFTTSYALIISLNFIYPFIFAQRITGTVAVHVVGQVVRGGSLPTLPVCPTWWHSIRITQEGLGN